MALQANQEGGRNPRTFFREPIPAPERDFFSRPPQSPWPDDADLGADKRGNGSSQAGRTTATPAPEPAEQSKLERWLRLYSAVVPQLITGFMENSPSRGLRFLLPVVQASQHAIGAFYSIKDKAALPLAFNAVSLGLDATQIVANLLPFQCLRRPVNAVATTLQLVQTGLIKYLQTTQVTSQAQAPNAKQWR